MPEVVAGFIGIAVVFVWIYCLYDVVTTEDALVRNLPKIAWFVIVLVLFDIGSILWLCFGRPRIQGGRVVGVERQRSRPRTTSSVVSHTDAPGLDHLHPVIREREERARLHMLEAQLRRRETELRARELGDGADS